MSELDKVAYLRMPVAGAFTYQADVDVRLVPTPLYVDRDAGREVGETLMYGRDNMGLGFRTVTP